MRVVHIVRQFSPSVGGLEDTVLSLARAQRERLKIDAHVVTLDRVFGTQALLPPEGIVEGVPVRRVPWSGSSRYPLAPSVVRHLQNADVVHVHAVDFFFDYLALMRLVHRRKMIATTHGGFFHTGAFTRVKKLWFQTITRASVTAYDQIVACSYSDEELFRRSAGRRLTVIENGITQTKFGGASSLTPRKTILSFGRFARHKRNECLLAVLKFLHTADPSWRLIVAGREADQTAAELMQIAQQLGVVGAVEFVLNPSDAELRILMGEASFYGSLSAYEGFGLAAVEAMSAGLVPILSGIPAFKRLVSSAGVGLTVDADDALAAAKAILSLSNHDENVYAEWRRQVMKTAARYDWQEVAGRYAILYENAIGKGEAIRPLVSSGVAD